MNVSESGFGDQGGQETENGLFHRRGLFSDAFRERLARFAGGSGDEQHPADIETGIRRPRLVQNMDDGSQLDWSVWRHFSGSPYGREWRAPVSRSRCLACIYVLGGLFASLRQRRILHDIIPCGEDAEIDRYLQRLLPAAREQQREGITLFAVHRGYFPHIHVLHDCAWSNMSCRCTFLLGSRIKRRTRRAVWRSDLTSEAFFDIAAYVLKKPRELVFCHVGGSSWEFGDGSALVGLCLCDAIRRETALGERDSEGLSCDRWSVGSCAETDCGPRFGGGEEDSERRGCGSNRKEDLLLNFMKRHVCVPLSNIVMTREWIESSYKYKGRNWDSLQSVINVFHMQIMGLTFAEIGSLIVPTSCRYASIVGETADYYYGPEETKEILDDLLAYQVGKDNIANFKNMVLDIVDKKIPKRNCLQIVGESCAGKNFFFDALLDACINKGCIGNFNRYTNFPLQEAHDRRILLWNEPNFESSALETLKLLFGGDNLSAKIKYQGDVLIHRTPVIVLTNSNIIPVGETAFDSRVVTYEWKSYGKLKEYEKKPFPGAMYAYMYQ